MNFRLEQFLREREAAFGWPACLQEQQEALAAKLSAALTPPVLAGFGLELQDRAIETAKGRLGLPAEASLVFGHSAVQLIEQILLILARGMSVCCVDPDFFLFKQLFRKLGIGLSGFASIDELCAQAPEEQPVLLSAPNNPTGLDLEDDSLHRLLESRIGLIIIDETYALFSGDPNRRLRLLKHHPQLVLVRGLSKTGLAGAGFGFFMAANETVERYLDGRVTGLISGAQAALACALFQHYSDLTGLVQALLREKEAAADLIARQSTLQPLPGDCDFLLVRCADGNPDLLTRKLNAANLPALSYSRLAGYEDVIKLFPVTYTQTTRLIETVSSVTEQP